MNSHLLNYRFSPYQNDIQYSPPCSTSAEPCWWTCKQPSSSWLPPLQETTLAAGPHAGAAARTLLHPLLLLITPHPCSIENGSVERERVLEVPGRRKGDDRREVILSTLGSSQPLPAVGLTLSLLFSYVIYSSLAEPGQGTWSSVVVCNEYSVLFKRAALSPCLSCFCFKWS